MVRNFFTSSFEMAVTNSAVDPVPMNRKSRRAMGKIVKKLMK